MSEATPLPFARRPETAADAAFRFALFCASRPPGEDLAGLDAELAATLLRHQFAGQAASLATAFPHARRDIVEVDGTPVGRIVVDAGEGEWTILDLALLPAWRGRGLGSRLVTAVTAAAAVAHAVVRLRVMTSNAAAARLYRRLGFAAVAASEVDVEMVWEPAPAAGSTAPSQRIDTP